jgi:hypothetical protein
MSSFLWFIILLRLVLLLLVVMKNLKGLHEITNTELCSAMSSWWLDDALHWARNIQKSWSIKFLLGFTYIKVRIHFYCNKWLYYNHIQHQCPSSYFYLYIIFLRFCPTLDYFCPSALVRIWGETWTRGWGRDMGRGFGERHEHGSWGETWAGIGGCGMVGLEG